MVAIEFKSEGDTKVRNVEKILFLGLGRMGLPMAGHMLRENLSVRGYDLSPERMRLFTELGGQSASDLREAIAQADAILILVGAERDVSTLYRSDDGIFACGKPGLISLVMSTVSPSFLGTIASDADAHGVHVIDAPVCRAEMGAVSGTLLTFLSGDKAVCAQAEALVRPFSADIEYVGDRVGAAQVAKTVNNLMLWAAVSGTYEGIKLAEMWGLDITALRRALETSSADSWALRNWDRIGQMPWSKKDMEIALKTGEEIGLAMPIGEAVQQEVAVIPVLSHA